MIQAQRGLDGFAIRRTNCQPACGPGRERLLKRGEWFHGSGQEPHRTRPLAQCQHPNERHRARAKHEPKHCQQHQRNRVHRIHTLNLRPCTAGSNKILVKACSSGGQSAPSSCETRKAMSRLTRLHFAPTRQRARVNGPFTSCRNQELMRIVCWTSEMRNAKRKVREGGRVKLRHVALRHPIWRSSEKAKTE